MNSSNDETKSMPRRILILEDAEQIAKGYEKILNSQSAGQYDVTLCFNGEDLQNRIDRKEKFDLAIMDVMLPTEDPQEHALADCHTTGVRLIRQMIKKEICRRFYVITVSGEFKEEIENMCKDSAVLRFEDKLDHEPEYFAENVERLLEHAIDKGTKNLLLEIKEHLDIVGGYAKKRNLLGPTDKEQMMASMASIQKILKRATDSDLGIDLNRAESVLRLEYIPNTTGALKKEAERTLAAIQEWFKRRAHK